MATILTQGDYRDSQTGKVVFPLPNGVVIWVGACSFAGGGESDGMDASLIARMKELEKENSISKNG